MNGAEHRRRQQPMEVSIPSNGITLLESHHAVSFQMEMGRWPFDKLCWIPVGRGKLALLEERFSIRKDDLLLLPEGTWHRFVDAPADPLTLVVVCFERSKIGTSEELLGKLDATNSLGRPTRGKKKRTRTKIGDAFRRMLREQKTRQTGFEFVLQAELANLLVDFLRDCTDSPSAVTSSDQAITDSLQYLDAYYYKPVQLGELAGHYSLSPRRFSELFKQRTGRTLIDYVNAKRVASAQERLRVTGHITYACLEAGFSDLGYFYRVFKKYTGQTPGAYLRMLPSPPEQE